MKDYKDLSFSTKYQQGDRSPEVVKLWNERSRETMRKRRLFTETKEQRLKDNAHTLHAIACKRVSKAKMGGRVADDAEEVKAIKALYYKICEINEILGKPTYCLDHIIPICQGGDHTLDNVQILTISENAKKSARERKETRPKMHKDKITRR